LRTVEVALGMILRDRRILICRRRDAGHLAGYWEFPGGKCEPGESPLQTLHRELAEEVGVHVEAVHRFPPMDHMYPEVHVRLHAFVCRHVDGEAHPHAADELQWIDPARLAEFRFPEANAPLLAQFMAYLGDEGSPVPQRDSNS
jgi:8-oxo-dGTP diphosphatase